MLETIRRKVRNVLEGPDHEKQTANPFELAVYRAAAITGSEPEVMLRRLVYDYYSCRHHLHLKG
jgi:hypothetical protein